MAGSKKLKKALSTLKPSPPPVPTTDEDEDGDLVNDLLAQLDSRDRAVQTESANILNEMHLTDKADEIASSGKQDPKSRFKARQVWHHSLYER